MPSVGAYSPEITSSIYYQVLSKLNPYVKLDIMEGDENNEI